jgi:hypothetical protein
MRRPEADEAGGQSDRDDRGHGQLEAREAGTRWSGGPKNRRRRKATLPQEKFTSDKENSHVKRSNSVRTGRKDMDAQEEIGYYS